MYRIDRRPAPDASFWRPRLTCERPYPILSTLVHFLHPLCVWCNEQRSGVKKSHAPSSSPAVVRAFDESSHNHEHQLLAGWKFDLFSMNRPQRLNLSTKRPRHAIREALQAKSASTRVGQFVGPIG
jgi:hypothetical protein